MKSKNKYAGQKKVEKDIERKLRKERSSEKSNDKKKKQQSIWYYTKILKKNNG